MEGEKVQPDWLHGFLMDPTALRPAVVMRMPNFHMSSGEAAKLVNYFAASSDVEFPYEYKPQQRASYLAEAETAHPERMDQAMDIVVNGNYCVKCHGVADFLPAGRQDNVWTESGERLPPLCGLSMFAIGSPTRNASCRTPACL